ncbi:MAG TPA: hypothetical protein VGQ48_11670 [Gemmatimonadales bacterium]|jgi:proteasome lid subunit RPN8/RPN11|nr:hypothetical protein [Gemmatimonadales bacterium]
MSARAEPKSQAMPMDRAILWNPSLPGAKPSGRAPYPIFFQQEAVIALQEHVKSSPSQAIFGFLIGDLYRDPENGVLYTVIDKTLKLSQAIYGDKTEVVVSRLWDRMQEQLTKAAGLLLGWYHSHPGQGGYLTAHDVETHEKFFTDPWHVAILVAAEAGGVTGKFFRTTPGNDDWHKTPLSFYELLQPESIKPDGKKRSFITWRNYKAYGPTLTGPKQKAVTPPAPPPAPVEEEEEEEEAAHEAPAEATRETPAPDRGFRIMRSSADDIPVIKTSADDEPAPPPRPEPPPPPAPPAPPPRPRRESQSKTRPAAPVFVPDEPPAPKPPPAPPQRSSDDIPWQVTPESVASLPPAIAAPPPPPLAPRRTPHTFRLLDEEAERKPAPKARRRKRRGPWLRRFAILLLLAGVGAGAYWYFALRNPGVPPPWAGLLERAKKLVSRSTPPRSRPAPPPQSTRRTTPAIPPASVDRPPAAPPPQAVASPFARFDRLSDSLSRAVRNFHDRAALFANGQMDCGGLAAGLVSIESLWITYNTERRARMASFDSRRTSQDQALYAAVDSVESRFEHSGCPRP